MKNHAKKLVVALVLISSLFFLGCPQAGSPVPDPTYTVTFNSNEGSSVDAITKNSGVQIEAPKNPTKVGFNFEGWYSNAGFAPASKVTFPYTVNANVTFYANWLHTTASEVVSFETNGGSAIPDSIVRNGESIEVPEHPTKKDFYFVGWYSDNGTFKDRVDFPFPPTRNITIYAKWLSVSGSHTISFETNGGTAISDSAVKGGDILPEPTKPTKANHTFGEWYLDAAFANKIDFTTYTVTANITLYAKWTENVKYTINFDANDGTPVTAITKYVGEKIETAPSTTKEGFNFDGWYFDAGFTQPVTFPHSVTATGTLYAKWMDKVNSWVVKFVTNEGSSIPDSVVAKDSTISEPKSTRENYTLVGWYSDAEFANKIDFTTYKVTANITLYAKWTEKAKFTVSFNSNGGTLVTAITKYADETIGIADTTKLNHTLEGWYTDIGLTPANKVSFPYPVIATVTLYAKWTADPKYTVWFDTNEGSSINPIEKYKGEKIDAPANPTKPNYTFEGWYSDAGFANKIDFATFTVTVDVTFYAKWKENAKYTVDFKTYDGIAVTAITKYADEKIETAPSTTKEGFNFEGWYTDASFTPANKVNFPYPVTANVELHAKWESKATSWVVKFVTNGGSTIPDSVVAKGNSIDTPKSTREDYTLEGWYTDIGLTPASKVNFPHPVTADTTLYAKWVERQSFMVSFNSNRGNPVSPIAKYAGERIETSPETTRANHTFAGWHSDEGLTKKENFPYTPTKNITLHAKWTEKISYTVSFETNGGTPVTSITQYAGQQINDAITTKTGNNFEGWYSNASFTPANKVTFPYPVTASVKLYAKWTVDATVLSLDSLGIMLHDRANFSATGSNNSGVLQSTKDKLLRTYNNNGVVTELLLPYNGQYYLYTKTANYSNVEISSEWNFDWRRDDYIEAIPQDSAGLFDSLGKIKAEKKTDYINYLKTEVYTNRDIPLPTLDEIADALTVTLDVANKTATITGKYFQGGNPVLSDLNITITNIGTTTIDQSLINEAEAAIYEFLNPPPISGIQYDNIGEKLHEGNFTLSQKKGTETVFTEIGKLTDGQGYMTDFDETMKYQFKQGGLSFIGSGNDFSITDGWDSIQRQSPIFAFIPENTRGIWNNNVMNKDLYWERVAKNGDYYLGNNNNFQNNNQTYFMNNISVTSANDEVEISFRWGNKADTWTDANTTVYTWKYSDIGKTMLNSGDLPQDKITLVKNYVDYMNPPQPTTQLSESNVGAYLKQSNFTVFIDSWNQAIFYSGKTLKVTGAGFEGYEVLQNNKYYLVQSDGVDTYVDVSDTSQGTSILYSLFSSFLPDDITGLFKTDGTIANLTTYKAKLPVLMQNDMPQAFTVVPDFANKTVTITGVVRQENQDVTQTETYTNIGTTTVDVPGWVYNAINSSGL